MKFYYFDKRHLRHQAPSMRVRRIRPAVFFLVVAAGALIQAAIVWRIFQ